MKISDTIERLQSREHLSRVEAREVMQELLSGVVPDAEITSFLVALRQKGERVPELVGFAETMRANALEVLRRAGVNPEDLVDGEPLVDTCGTGGDDQGTFNVSTAAAIVAAATGLRVAKHGNRSISSRCGSADVLEALGVKIELPLERIPECLERTGLVFLFAPRLHLAMKYVMNARRSLKAKTVFNLLGPLTNPLGASIQLVGVYDREHTASMAEALAAVGTRRAFVVAGCDGLDEITLTGPTQLSESEGLFVRTREILPEDFGLERSSTRELKGGDAETNARILRCVFEGEMGPRRDFVLANASAVLVAAGKAADFREGMERAREEIDSGGALEKLERLVTVTGRLCQR